MVPFTSMTPIVPGELVRRVRARVLNVLMPRFPVASLLSILLGQAVVLTTIGTGLTRRAPIITWLLVPRQLVQWVVLSPLKVTTILVLLVAMTGEHIPLLKCIQAIIELFCRSTLRILSIPILQFLLTSRWLSSPDVSRSFRLLMFITTISAAPTLLASST